MRPVGTCRDEVQKASPAELSNVVAAWRGGRLHSEAPHNESSSLEGLELSVAWCSHDQMIVWVAAKVPRSD